VFSTGQNGKGYISHPAKTDRRTKEQRRRKKYLSRSLVSSFAMNVRTREAKMLNMSIKKK
jgi:hypothetical protein